MSSGVASKTPSVIDGYARAVNPGFTLRHSDAMF